MKAVHKAFHQMFPADIARVAYRIRNYPAELFDRLWIGVLHLPPQRRAVGVRALGDHNGAMDSLGVGGRTLVGIQGARAGTGKRGRDGPFLSQVRRP